MTWSLTVLLKLVTMLLLKSFRAKILFCCNNNKTKKWNESQRIDDFCISTLFSKNLEHLNFEPKQRTNVFLVRFSKSTQQLWPSSSLSSASASSSLPLSSLPLPWPPPWSSSGSWTIRCNKYGQFLHKHYEWMTCLWPPWWLYCLFRSIYQAMPSSLGKVNLITLYYHSS